METADSLTTPSVAENRCQQLSDKNRMINRDEIMYYLPPGMVFHPTPRELINQYLIPKANKQELPPNKINDAKFYESDPEKLAEKYKADMWEYNGKQELYFFSAREKKHKGGNKKANRAAGNGFWRPSGVDKLIKHRGEVIGFHRKLSHHKGTYKKGSTKTVWLAEEFRLKDPPAPVPTTNQDNMKFDDCVIYKLYKKMDDQIDPDPTPAPLSPKQAQDIPESSRTTANTVEMDDRTDPTPAPLSPTQGQNNDSHRHIPGKEILGFPCPEHTSLGMYDHYYQQESSGGIDLVANQIMGIMNQGFPGTSLDGTNQF